MTSEPSSREKKLAEAAQLAINALSDVERIGWSRAVDPKRWAHEVAKCLQAALQPESAPAPAEEPRRVCLSCGKTGGDHWPSCPRFAPAPPEPPPAQQCRTCAEVPLVVACPECGAQPKSFPHRLTVYEFAYTSSTPCAVCRRPVSEHPEQVPYVQVEAAQPKGETR